MGEHANAVKGTENIAARILVVDDSPVEIKIIRRLLANQYEVVEANSGTMAIKLAKEQHPDLILLDILMPAMNGLAVCKQLKSELATRDIPVIFITAVSEAHDVVRGLEAGGQDYITKPFYSPELCARIKVHLELKQMQQKITKYAYDLEVKNNQLRKLTEQLEFTAMTDFMTGLFNRRSMTLELKKQLVKIRKNKSSAVVIIADLDDFKQVNDTYGHDCGDEVLKTVTNIMQEVVRGNGVIARWGGEEFLMLLYNTKLFCGVITAEKIRNEVAKHVFHYKDKPLSLTLTLGVVELDCEKGVDASIKSADEALYQGKTMSKNCVVSI